MHNFNSSFNYKDQKHLINICDQEPIHIPGSIQSSGMVLVFGQDCKVKFSSENSSEWFNISHENLIGLAPDAIFESQDIILKIFDHLDVNEYFYKQKLLNSDELFDITLVANTESGYKTVEIEKSEEANLDSIALEKGINALGICEDAQSLYDEAVKWVRETIDYDRVKLYLFDEDWNGTVVAENKAEFMPSYKGLMFPATDIPKQARALYVLNKVRVISDVYSEPVNLLPKAPLAQAVDLSQSGLRSISPIHIEYLRNMKVGASFSASVVIEGKLVGLIACHHSKAKHIPLRARRQAEIFGRTLSLEMQRIKFRMSKHLRRSAKKVSRKILESVNQANLEIGIKNELPEIQRILKADGVGLKYGDNYYFSGVALDPMEIQQVEERLEQRERKRIYTTKTLNKTVPGLVATGIYGFLRIPVEFRSPITLFAFRKEFHDSIKWGGADLENAKTIYADEEGRMRVSPRKSFETFKVNTKEQSLPWLEGLLYEELASGLRELVLNKHGSLTNETDMLSKKAQLKIDELTSVIRQLRFEVAESRSVEHKLQLALDVSAVGSWEIDLNENRILMDFTTRQVLEAGGNEKTLEQFISLFPIGERQELSESLKSLSAEGKKYSKEVQFETEDGQKSVLLKAEGYALGENESTKLVGVVMDISSMRAMEMDIRYIQEELEQFFNADLVGTFISNDDGDIIRCNTYLLQLLGFPPNQLDIGSVNWKMLTPVDQYSIDLEQIKQTKLGDKVNYSKQMFDANGKRIEVLFSLSYNDESDRFYGVVKSNMDEIVERNKAETIIKEQRKMLLERHKTLQAFNKDLIDANERLKREIALREKTEKDRVLLEKAVTNAQEMIVITDAEFVKTGGQPRITYVNDALLKMTGYTEEEVLGNSPKMFQNSNTSNDARRKINEALFKKEPVKTRITNCSKTGEEYIVELSISPVFGPQGELVNFVGVQQDVTKEVEQLKKIENARLQFESIASNLPQSLVLLTGVDGRIVYLGGQNKKKLNGRPEYLFQLFNTEATNSIGFSKWAASRSIETYGFTAKNRQKSYDVICSKAGEDSIIILAQDISQRLELAVKERELAQAESITKMKTDFINHASHQLKTPISSIELNISVLRHVLEGKQLSANVLSVLERLEKESKRLMELTKNTLEVSRVTDRTYKSKPVEVDLIDFIHGIADLFLNTKEYANRSIKVSTRLKTAKIETDEFLIGQILQNLVSNALKYSEGEVMIKLQNSKSKRGGYELSVHDQGIGIPDEDLDMIFNEFYRSNNSGRAHGTGLGLYLVKKSVELIHGDIKVESKVGKGTIFKLRLS